MTRMRMVFCNWRLGFALLGDEVRIGKPIELPDGELMDVLAVEREGLAGCGLSEANRLGLPASARLLNSLCVKNPLVWCQTV